MVAAAQTNVTGQGNCAVRVKCVTPHLVDHPQGTRGKQVVGRLLSVGVLSEW